MRVAEAGGSSDESRAFEAAKELGTVEAWDAFLSNYPKGFHADLARAYVKKLGEGAAPDGPGKPAAAAAVTGLNVTYVEYVAGAFVKNGAKTWVEQKKAGGDALRFNETSRTEREVKLFDPSRNVEIVLNLAGNSIWYAHNGGESAKLYDIVSIRGGDVSTTAREPVDSSALAR
jgi:hypothetical protein